jgi:hypothetical protein
MLKFPRTTAMLLLIFSGLGGFSEGAISLPKPVITGRPVIHETDGVRAIPHS